MEKFNRRDFVKIAGLFAGSAALAACAPGLANLDSTPSAEPTELSLTPVKSAGTPLSPFSEEEIIVKKPEILKPKFLYFSQKDPKWQDIPNSGKATMYGWGCGIATGGEATWTDPYKYWEYCTDVYGKDISLGESGTNWKWHVPVLLGHKLTPVPIEGKLVYIKQQIKEKTDKGIPVWINADILGYGHNTLAVGIKESNQHIIFNDPYYGEGIAFADHHINMNTWKVNAIIPPAH